MDVDAGIAGAGEGEGLRTYYITKIEELMLTVTDKRQDVRRLQVSRVNIMYCECSLAVRSHLMIVTCRLSEMS